MTIGKWFRGNGIGKNHTKSKSVLRNYFEGLAGISFFYVVSGSFGVVEFDPVGRIIAVLDRIVVDIVAEAVVIRAVDIGEYGTDHAFYEFLGIIGRVGVDGKFILFAVI